MDPQTLQEWCELARRKRRAAEILLASAQFEEAWFSAGFAVECALKAAIFAHERFGIWPSRAARPDLYIHDLTKLFQLAGIDLPSLTGDPVAPKIMAVRLGQRSDGYMIKMPRKVARDICEAAFSQQGVFRWISIHFQIPL